MNGNYKLRITNYESKTKQKIIVGYNLFIIAFSALSLSFAVDS